MNIIYYRPWDTRIHFCVCPLHANKNYILSLFKFSSHVQAIKSILYIRQADYISQVAAIDGSLSGIEHWWIGLTDLGK